MAAAAADIEGLTCRFAYCSRSKRRRSYITHERELACLLTGAATTKNRCIGQG